jgi:hypothetical protein
MTDKFSEREKGFEAKFKLDEENAFKVAARRNKLLGLWLAEQLGILESEIEDYVSSVVRADLEEPGDEDFIRKVLADVEERNAYISEDQVHAQLAEFEQEARNHFMAE